MVLRRRGQCHHQKEGTKILYQRVKDSFLLRQLHMINCIYTSRTCFVVNDVLTNFSETSKWSSSNNCHPPDGCFCLFDGIGKEEEEKEDGWKRGRPNWETARPSVSTFQEDRSSDEVSDDDQRVAWNQHQSQNWTRQRAGKFFIIKLVWFDRHFLPTNSFVIHRITTTSERKL